MKNIFDRKMILMQKSIKRSWGEQFLNLNEH